MRPGQRRTDLFRVEAEEYLADLDLLSASAEPVDPERVIRGARNLRGAAMLAGLASFARAAASLEALARQLRSEALEWDYATRDEIASAVATFRSFLPQQGRWENDSDQKALALAERLERFSGGSHLPGQGSQPSLTAGVRAFIARESALIAGSLEKAARALSPLPPAEALAAVLERMRSLRGLGASSELSPLPEMLDAMEIATRLLLADDPAPPDVADIFDEAAQALASIARGIAESGRLTVPPELDRVALRLLTAYAEQPDVVPITSLAPDGEEAILRVGIPPQTGSTPVPIELVGVGDHLLLMADTLARPSLPVVRDLRLFVLHRTLATMPPRSPTTGFLRPLTEAITASVAHRVATRELDQFLLLLRDVGRFLIDGGASNDLGALERKRDVLIGAWIQFDPAQAATPALQAAEITVHEELDTRRQVEEILVRHSLPQPDNPAQPVEITLAKPEPVSDPAGPGRPTPVSSSNEDPFGIGNTSFQAPTSEAVPPTTPPGDEDTPGAESPTVPNSQAEPVSINQLLLGSESTSAPLEETEDAVGDIIPITELLITPPPSTALKVADSPSEDTDDEPVPMRQLVLITPDVPEPMEDLVGTPIVPVQALMYDSERPPVIPRRAPGQPSRLETAFHGYARLMQQTPSGPASIEFLLQPEVVPIATLLYRGESALQRADELRRTILERLTLPSLTTEDLRPELEELLDLVELARNAA